MCADPMIHFAYKVSTELRIAEKVCEVLEVNHRHDFNITDYNYFLEVLKTQLAITAGVPIPFCNVDLINYFDQIKNDYTIHITGYAGTEGFTQEMKKLSLFSSKFDIKAQFGKRYHYLDIFNNDFITRNEFNNALTTKFQGWLKQIGTDKFEHAATYFSIFGCVKGWHGTLMNTQTCIIPVYAPFYDIDCIRTMLETDYKIKKWHKIQKQIINSLYPKVSPITTMYGYNADPEANNFRLTIKDDCKDLIRRFVHQSTTLVSLRQYLEKHLYPAMDVNEYEETYCERYVNEQYSKNMKIFTFVDRSKIEKQINDMAKKRKQSILARLVFINGMMEKYNIN